MLRNSRRTGQARRCGRSFPRNSAPLVRSSSMTALPKYACFRYFPNGRRSEMNMGSTWVVTEQHKGQPLPIAFELLGAARDLTDNVRAITFGQGATAAAKLLGDCL